jgi:hypothetical protein
VKFVARVGSPAGPLKDASVEIVSPEGRTVIAIGKGVVTDGELSATADVGAVWGVWIDRQAVVALPVTIDGELVDLGEIVMVPDGIAWPAFHATKGRVYGAPPAALPAPAAAAPPPAPEPIGLPRILPTGDPMPQIVRKMTFGDLFGNTARQFASAASTVKSNFVLSGATVTLKGVPSATTEAIALEFPTTEVAATGIGLSEVSFSMRPVADTPPITPPAPAGPTVPDLTGYTRELAIRKAAAAGFITEINNTIVTDAAQAGRVIRHLPAAGAALAPGAVIRLYIGKPGGT